MEWKASIGDLAPVYFPKHLLLLHSLSLTMLQLQAFFLGFKHISSFLPYGSCTASLEWLNPGTLHGWLLIFQVQTQKVTTSSERLILTTLLKTARSPTDYHFILFYSLYLSIFKIFVFVSCLSPPTVSKLFDDSSIVLFLYSPEQYLIFTQSVPNIESLTNWLLDTVLRPLYAAPHFIPHRAI